MISAISKWFAKKEATIKPTIVHSIFKEGKRIDGVMTVTWSDGTVKEYIGCVTVWHTFPLMGEVDTLTQGDLYRVWMYHRSFGNPYPTAHEKTETNV